ncbi:hypothetical protein T265_03708 [Opisthorchis viverrini]|uniref:Nematode fatty acid retinoid binding protein n=1 Tax=Opisthorchis viverrini TaxID=6198 RepID=A0A075A2F3_OPIVI|nr:hypothetical protein T265_03708 [Opisthorchis viverrini]KER29690.1 hypothetical protein T265_03708 [Opisthorchis viverrini]
MRGFILVCLTALLLIMAYAEARPETDAKKKLRESGMKLMETVRMAMLKMYEKCKEKFIKYMERDNLGEKLAAVVEICKFFPSVTGSFWLNSHRTSEETY